MPNRHGRRLRGLVAAGGWSAVRTNCGEESCASRTRAAIRALASTVLVTFIASCTQAVPQTPTVYATEYGLGPDKWATAWLLTRHADQLAKLEISPLTHVKPGSMLFDVPAASIRRVGNRSAFEVARAQLGRSDNDAALDELAQIVHEIEINFWSAGGPSEARLVEDAFRGLQYRYGRDAVTPQCYVAFFERVYRTLQDAKAKSIPVSAERLQMSCEELTHLADKHGDLVPEVPIVDVLSAAAAGRKVIFIDVREADEYAEGHIPGALNIPIRDVGASLRERLQGADYVVSYCVKDFRGFEMAKALARLGIEHSVIMRPYGIKGWVALGLPVTGTRGLTEGDAQAEFRRCLANTSDCLSRGAASI
jgi:rhodanese-related sulfurtransferase